MSSLLHWLPALPDADAAFARLKATADPGERLAQIAAIAGHQLDFVQTGKLDRQLERTVAELAKFDERSEAMGGGDPASFAGGAGGKALRGVPGVQPVRVAWLGSPQP